MLVGHGQPGAVVEIVHTQVKRAVVFNVDQVFADQVGGFGGAVGGDDDAGHVNAVNITKLDQDIKAGLAGIKVVIGKDDVRRERLFAVLCLGQGIFGRCTGLGGNHDAIPVFQHGAHAIKNGRFVIKAQHTKPAQFARHAAFGFGRSGGIGNTQRHFDREDRATTGAGRRCTTSPAVTSRCAPPAWKDWCAATPAMPWRFRSSRASKSCRA
mgnify:CR=1 FL=1